MVIKIKKLTIRNFRGLEKFELDNMPVNVLIYGKNGSGKTSIYDAWLWLLFGKDHEGRADFELKPKGRERTNVEVSATLMIDEKPLTLSRVYREEWVMSNKEEREVLKGHTTDYYINEVGVKMKEYNERVAQLCNEDLFKTITNPLHFTSLKKDDQRALLFSLIPEITDEQIASGNDDFVAILKEVSGVSMDNFRKELAKKISMLNADIEKIPTQIETTNSNMPTSEDWADIENQIKEKKEVLKDIEAKIFDTNTANENENKRVRAIQAQINEYELQNDKIVRQEKEQIEDDIARKQREVQKLLIEIGDIEREYKTKSARHEQLKKDIVFYNNKIDNLRKQWFEISSEKFSFNENELICPTCKQTLPEHDIEEKQAHMREAFNKSKADRLKANQDDGIKIKSLIAEINKEIDRLNVPEAPDTSEKQREIDRIKDELTVLRAKTPQPEHSILYQANRKKIDELREQINVSVEQQSINDLKRQKQEITSQIDSLKKRLYKREQIEELQKQIEQYNKRKVILNQELTRLQGKEYILKKFESAKNAEYESRINLLFEKVQFRLFKKQVNGAIVPDCEATMNGVNFSTLSNAQKIYAGLDIIQAISNHQDIYAPIFIDNRESTTNIPAMSEKTQIVNLYVDPDYEVLTVI